MKFGLEVAKHVINENLSKNESVVFSPTSVDTVLNILATGAVDSTLEQLLKFLGHDDLKELNAASTKLYEALKASDDKNKLEISYVNGLWLDQRFSLNAEFANLLKKDHNVQATVVDFVNQPNQVVKEVNAWAKQETKGLIKQILTRNNIQKNTAMILANALYFKGKWQNSFKAEDTKDSAFNLLDGHKVRVPFMKQWHEKFHYGSFDDCQVIKMPYQRVQLTSNTFSMYIFLPIEKNGLPNFMENIELHENMFINKFKLDKVKVNEPSIPKFKLESHFGLTETMKQLGLTIDCLDFSRIFDKNDEDEPLYVNGIVQKCCVETNEIGTKAAAVTATFMIRASRPVRPPPKIIKFVADHPFMFMIREDTSGAILFVGTMLNPK